MSETETTTSKRLPYCLMVDSGQTWNEPPTRHFGSLDAAMKAARELDPEWWRFAWIIDKDERRVYRVNDIAAAFPDVVKDDA